MSETANLVLAIYGAIMIWTSSIIGGIIWLNAKFRGLERTIYREMDKMRREHEAHNYNHNTRIQRLEIRAFGFKGSNGGSIVPDVDRAED